MNAHAHAPRAVTPVAIPPARAQTIEVGIQGMTCASCVGRVERAVATVPGVAAVSVNLATERATVSHDGTADTAAIAAAIAGAGYSVAAETAEFAVEGMTCASCVGRIERAVGAVPGVVRASVNLSTERAEVAYLPGQVSTDRVIAAIREAGYVARLAQGGAVQGADAEQTARDARVRGLRFDLILSASLAIPVFAVEMGSHFLPPLHAWLNGTVGMTNLLLFSFIAITGVIFGPGQRFFRKGVPALIRRAPDMDSLVVLGTGAAYLYSVAATFLPGIFPAGTAQAYYESVGVVITLILLGRYLETLAKGRTSEAIRRLMTLQAKTARLMRGGLEVEVPIEAVTVGDIVVVRPGERIAVDGDVVEGSSYVDEAMISGEPVPVAKQPGDAVIGGTINTRGSFSFRATKIGADTMLSQIIRMVETAQGSKLPIQALLDRITMWFVPAVIAAAALTFGVWLVFGPDPALSFGLINLVAVLIIACPCAMGLATPTSIMVGTGKAAEMGVLFRRGEALQSLRDATVVALDKTGTLTRGKPELIDLVVRTGFEADAVLRLVAAVEARSEHPVATAIVEAARQKHLVIPASRDFEAIAGFGAEGEVEGHRVQVGADRYMAKLGLDVADFATAAARLGDLGRTPLYAAIDGTLAAVIAVADPVRDTTPAAIAALHRLGMKVAMISGDNRRTAEAIARELGIDEVVAEVLPAGKVEAIAALQAKGHKVAFVGDGINDAPALAQADVGLAIGSGTDIAIEAADVVLLGGDLKGVPNAIALSQATLRNIKQNLFWAFAYNTLLIPVAAGVLYPAFGVLLSPVLAAGAMGFSSVFVLGNALRLNWFTAPNLVAAHPVRK
jgi:heavy metal translocating P-type ATPase